MTIMHSPDQELCFMYFGYFFSKAVICRNFTTEFLLINKSTPKRSCTVDVSRLWCCECPCQCVKTTVAQSEMMLMLPGNRLLWSLIWQIMRCLDSSKDERMPLLNVISADCCYFRWGLIYFLTISSLHYKLNWCLIQWVPPESLS